MRAAHEGCSLQARRHRPRGRGAGKRANRQASAMRAVPAVRWAPRMVLLLLSLPVMMLPTCAEMRPPDVPRSGVAMARDRATSTTVQRSKVSQPQVCKEPLAAHTTAV